MAERRILICLRTNEVRLNTGDVAMSCADCGGQVVVSPSSWQILNDNPGIEVVCKHCADQQEGRSRSVTVHPITDGQVADLVDILLDDDQ